MTYEFCMLFTTTMSYNKTSLILKTPFAVEGSRVKTANLIISYFSKAELSTEHKVTLPSYSSLILVP